jgi:hypothetical protein
MWLRMGHTDDCCKHDSQRSRLLKCGEFSISLLINSYLRRTLLGWVGHKYSNYALHIFPDEFKRIVVVIPHRFQFNISNVIRYFTKLNAENNPLFSVYISRVINHFFFVYFACKEYHTVFCAHVLNTFGTRFTRYCCIKYTKRWSYFFVMKIILTYFIPYQRAVYLSLHVSYS